MTQKSFTNVWKDIQNIITAVDTVKTLCRKVENEIVEVTSYYVSVRSDKPKAGKIAGKIRTIKRDDFEYVWKTLVKHSIITLDHITEITGKRAVTCAILNELPYIEGECKSNRVYLKLISKS